MFCVAVSVVLELLGMGECGLENGWSQSA